MKQIITQWIIKTRSGEMIGPIDTKEVLKLIASQKVDGSEKIQKYPDGRWIEVSKQPEFFDELLKVLEDSKKAVRSAQEKKIEPIIEYVQETVIVNKNPIAKRQSEVSKKPTIVTIPLENNENKKKTKTNFKLIFNLIILLFVCVLVGILFIDDTKESEKPNLISPRLAGGTELPPQQIKEIVKNGIDVFVLDTFEGYQKAQTFFVQGVEGANKNLDLRGLLCLTYKELWTHVKQDSKDIETIQSLAKSTRQIDPVGINGIYCETTKLTVLGKFKEAKGLLENSLNQTQFSTAAVLYALRAEMFYDEGDFQTASLYSEKAASLWPEWVKAKVIQARSLIKIDNFQKAHSIYEQIIKENPKNKTAQLEYGLLKFYQLRQNENAEKILMSALATKFKVSRVLEARSYAALARILHSRAELKKAKEFAEKAYALNPVDIETKEVLKIMGGSSKLNNNASQAIELVFLGDQYSRKGDCLAAQAEYKTAFELNPSNGLIAVKAAKCLWQLNQSQEAISWLRKAIESDKKLVQAYVLSADYLSQKFDYQNAISILNRGASLFPNNYEILKGYGMVEFRRNNFKEALAYLLRSNKIYENDSETLILLAETQLLLRDYKEASKYSVRAIEVDASSAEAQIIYAKTLAELYGIDSGINYLKDLIKKFSYTTDYRLGLADLLRYSERYKQAQEAYEQLIQLDPKNKKAHLGLGESYQAQGLYNQALKSFYAAAILNPSDVEGVVRAGLVYLEKENYSEAVRQFQRAQKTNPNFPKINYYIGKAFFENGDYNFALTAAMEERKMNPNLADSYILAAEIYTNTKQFQKCAEEYQKALKLRPQGAEIYVKLAKCYRLAGSSDVAESMLNIAANQESGLPEIYKEQGAIFETKGDFRAAIAAYNKYLALSPNAPDRKEIQNRILTIGSDR
jgi:tetratricopeptide (TPR) repeat protein